MKSDFSLENYTPYVLHFCMRLEEIEPKHFGKEIQIVLSVIFLFHFLSIFLEKWDFVHLKAILHENSFLSMLASPYRRTPVATPLPETSHQVGQRSHQELGMKAQPAAAAAKGMLKGSLRTNHWSGRGGPAALSLPWSMTSTVLAGKTSLSLGAVLWLMACCICANIFCWLNAGVGAGLHLPPLGIVQDSRTPHFIGEAHKKQQL